MKMAILGAGWIAEYMANTIRHMPGVVSYAVGARDFARAQAFATEFGFEKAYGSYAEMLADPEIDLVYVATPHSHHYDCMKLCLEHGKNVLCEKSFTVSARQAKEILQLAKSKNLLVAEAIWTRYMPMRQTIIDTINSGVIGDVATMSASLCYANDDKYRIQEPALAGGAMLDLSVYMVNFVAAFFGTDFNKVTSVPVLTDKGCDAQNSMTFTYPDGKMAVVYSSTCAYSDLEAIFCGRKGYIKISNTNNYEDIRIYDQNRQLLQTIVAPEKITGYEYEVSACMHALENGLLECPEMPHSEIIRMMEIMDDMREEWGMHFPCE